MSCRKPISEKAQCTNSFSNPLQYLFEKVDIRGFIAWHSENLFMKYLCWFSRHIIGCDWRGKRWVNRIFIPLSSQKTSWRNQYRQILNFLTKFSFIDSRIHRGNLRHYLIMKLLNTSVAPTVLGYLWIFMWITWKQVELSNCMSESQWEIF